MAECGGVEGAQARLAGPDGEYARRPTTPGGFVGRPERLERRSPASPPEVPPALSVETARWVVDAARRVVEEFHSGAGRERPDWLD